MQTHYYDTLVIGGGIMGMLTARNLHFAGLQVAIIEKGDLGGKATWAAGGILASLHPWRLGQPARMLITESQRLFPALTEELKQETKIDPEAVCSGMIVLDTAEKNQAIRWASKNNEPIEFVTSRDLFELEPNLLPNFHEALYLPNVKQVRSPRLIQALKKSLQRCGVKTLEHLAVQKLLFQSSRVQGAITPQGKLFADKVVLCGGAWTTALLQPLTAKKTDIVPVRGQMLLYRPQTHLFSRILVNGETYLISRKDGLVLCGSTLEHVGFESNVTQQAADDLHAKAQEMCPGLKNAGLQQQWAALRPGTSRGVPYICEHPEITGLYINSGHYRNGIAMSTASANLLVGLVTNSIHASQVAPYAYQLP